MQRRLLALLAFAALLVFASPAEAKDNPAYVVSGSAVVDFPAYDETTQWTYDITGDPTTLAATGSFRGHTVAPGLDIDLTGAADCLNVAGNTAYLSGVITATNREDIPAGSTFYTSLTDGSASGTSDIVGPLYLNPGFTCTTALAPEFVVTSGDVAILTCDKVKNSGKCKAKDG